MGPRCKVYGLEKWNLYRAQGRGLGARMEGVGCNFWYSPLLVTGLPKATSHAQ